MTKSYSDKRIHQSKKVTQNVAVFVCSALFLCFATDTHQVHVLAHFCVCAEISFSNLFDNDLC